MKRPPGRLPLPRIAKLDGTGLVDDRGRTMKTQALTLLCVLAAALSEARADTPAPMDDGTDQLTLPKGRFVIDAFLEISLVSDAVFKPFSISPDVWYGVTDDITVGLVHSADGETGFIGGTGTTLCLSGSDDGCPNIYNNIGADIRYRLKEGTYALALDGGLFFQSFDPDVQLALKLGAAGRWHRDKIAVEAEPSLFFGLTNRDTDIGETSSVRTNGDFLLLPVTGLYAITPKISAAVQLGLILPFQNTGDTWAIPLSFGVHYLATEKLNIFAAFSLTRLFGGSSADAFDGRSLTIGGSYAL